MSAKEVISGIKKSEKLIVNSREDSEAKLIIKQFWKENDKEELKE